MRTHVIRGWIVGILAVLALVVAGAPAGAHAELESSDPKDGASLASAPAEISFTFGEQILDQGNAITLTVVDDSGQDAGPEARLDLGPVTVDGDTVTVAWPDASPAGEFRAAYRVVSADGHPIDGTITFTVQEAVGAVDSASPVSSASATPSASASAAPSASPAPADGEDGPSAGLLVWVIAVGLAVLVGAGAGAWVMRRTR
jgi:copper resistance protein C